jgi:hypothetical protein
VHHSCDRSHLDYERSYCRGRARHIAAHKIKFCVWGGYAPQLVGVPERYHQVVSRYPRVMVGQGCIVSDAALDQRQREYAVAYNTRMLNYVLHDRQ